MSVEEIAGKFRGKKVENLKVESAVIRSVSVENFCFWSQLLSGCLFNKDYFSRRILLNSQN